MHTLTGVWTCVCVCVCVRFSECLVHTDQVTRTIICICVIPRIRCHHMQRCSGKYKGQSSQAALHGQRAVLRKRVEIEYAQNTAKGSSQQDWVEMWGQPGTPIPAFLGAGFHTGSHKPSLHLIASFLSLSNHRFAR